MKDNFSVQAETQLVGALHLLHDPEVGSMDREETTWTTRPSRRTLDGRATMARIGKRDGEASLKGKKSNIVGQTFQMWPDNFSPGTFERGKRGERGKREGKFGRIVRRWSKGRSAFMRLGKRLNNKIGKEMILEKTGEPLELDEISSQETNPDFEFGDLGRNWRVGERWRRWRRRNCLEGGTCNVVLNRNGITYRIFYRNN